MPKKRVHEIAKEQGLTSKEVLAAFKDAGVYVKAASSTVEERDVRRAFPNGVPARPPAAEPAASTSTDAAESAEPETTTRDAAGRARVPRARATKRARARAAPPPATTAEAAAPTDAQTTPA